MPFFSKCRRQQFVRILLPLFCQHTLISAWKLLHEHREDLQCPAIFILWLYLSNALWNTSAPFALDLFRCYWTCWHFLNTRDRHRNIHGNNVFLGTVISRLDLVIWDGTIKAAFCRLTCLNKYPVFVTALSLFILVMFTKWRRARLLAPLGFTFIQTFVLYLSGLVERRNQYSSSEYWFTFSHCSNEPTFSHLYFFTPTEFTFSHCSNENEETFLANVFILFYFFVE